jgi:hypothetical protein
MSSSSKNYFFVDISISYHAIGGLAIGRGRGRIRKPLEISGDRHLKSLPFSSPPNPVEKQSFFDTDCQQERKSHAAPVNRSGPTCMCGPFWSPGRWTNPQAKGDDCIVGGDWRRVCR